MKISSCLKINRLTINFVFKNISILTFLTLFQIKKLLLGLQKKKHKQNQNIKQAKKKTFLFVKDLLTKHKATNR